MRNAIIYVPSELPTDAKLAARCNAYGRFHGFGSCVPMRDEEAAKWLVRIGWTDTIIVAGPTHVVHRWPIDAGDADGTSVTMKRFPGEEKTVVVLACHRAGRHRSPRRNTGTARVLPMRPRTADQLLEQTAHRWSAEFATKMWGYLGPTR